MTNKNEPVDLDALDAFIAAHVHESNCYDVCEAEKEIIDAYPALSAELRRLRGLVREYAEASDDWSVRTDGCGDRLMRATKLVYAAGKEIK